jgi:hypothetical protein
VVVGRLIRETAVVASVESFARYLVHDPVHHLHDVLWSGPASIR